MSLVLFDEMGEFLCSGLYEWNFCLFVWNISVKDQNVLHSVGIEWVVVTMLFRGEFVLLLFFFFQL